LIAGIQRKSNTALDLLQWKTIGTTFRHPKRLPGAEESLARVSALDEVMAKLAHATQPKRCGQVNYEVDANKHGQAEVVREWLKRKGF